MIAIKIIGEQYFSNLHALKLLAMVNKRIYGICCPFLWEVSIVEHVAESGIHAEFDTPYFCRSGVTAETSPHA